jgi:hypothetical protein
LIDGHEYFDRDKDIEIRREFEKKKKALEEKEAAAAKPGRRRNGAGAAGSDTEPNSEEDK